MFYEDGNCIIGFFDMVGGKVIGIEQFCFDNCEFQNCQQQCQFQFIVVVVSEFFEKLVFWVIGEGFFIKIIGDDWDCGEYVIGIEGVLVCCCNFSCFGLMSVMFFFECKCNEEIEWFVSCVIGFSGNIEKGFLIIVFGGVWG